jgi:hypothetical protein
MRLFLDASNRCNIDRTNLRLCNKSDCRHLDHSCAIQTIVSRSISHHTRFLCSHLHKHKHTGTHAHAGRASVHTRHCQCQWHITTAVSQVKKHTSYLRRISTGSRASCIFTSSDIITTSRFMTLVRIDLACVVTLPDPTSWAPQESSKCNTLSAKAVSRRRTNFCRALLRSFVGRPCVGAIMPC